jgi:uncharacterized membrane protein YqaE (UPF0057 family)
MKQFNFLILGIISTMILSACSTSNEVVGGVFQKRKHTGGVYWDRTEKVKTSAQKEEEEMEFDIYKLEEAKQKKYASVTTIKSETQTPENTVVASAESEDIDGLVIDEESKPVIEATVSTTTTENEKTLAASETKTIVKKQNTNKQTPVDEDVMFIILIILAFLIPPLAVFIYEGTTNRFWIDLVLAILGFGVGFWLLGGLGWLCGLAAVIYALLIVLEVI